ncbi:uncharacterized protein LOC656965 [Tribolium castaneum]|uniref:C3H1-type domain-containing protein n=1 Tax=Tribolium castaneum TaxID=7070 RepID=D6X270_TRICA|nr:PREDICTED: uncharacterized protein LOC656965 [Tribolium castaneum]EFA10221.1 hypothetical protein TcasGA2_TC012417 [Tribolium castaneum]|eukprot:XP_968551.1 PREDICTED: uncharacterized protein LOC656965 [Tribolium castaneum]
MSLVPDYDSSSSSASEADEEPVKPDARVPAKAPLKLPKPDFVGTSTDPDAPKSSVFKNPFAEAENAKEAILQKHVKMVDAKDNVVVINGKRICWNYRKGRCRFGHNCKYAHDSDLQKSKEQLQSEQQVQQSVVCQSQSLPEPSPHELEKIRQEAVTQKRKKRPGLTQGLVPGKKVMRNYVNQKL